MSPLNKYENMLNNLADALGNSEGQSLEEIKEELREEGVDVERLLSRGLALIERLKKERLNVVKKENK